MRASVVIIGSLLLLAGIRLSSEAAQVTLAWDASTDPTVVGYNVYYGTSSLQYSNQLAAGASTSITVSNLIGGATYYFAATAVNSAGLESAYSTEVACPVSGTCSVSLSNLVQVYDGTSKSVDVSTSPAGLVATVTYNGLTNKPVAAGNYQVIATVSTPGYLGSATNVLIISQATASVQWSNLSQTYDGTPKPVSVSSSPPGLEVNLNYNGLTSVPVNAGSYPVVAAIVDPNYTGGASNVLCISKANASVQLANLTQTYDGYPKTASASSIPAGLPINLTFNGSAAFPVNAGPYQIMATIADANYQGSSASLFTISKAAAMVQLGNLNQTYDGAPKIVSVSTIPSGLSVTLTYNGQNQAPSKPGSYTVVGTITGINYYGAATNTLTITKTKGHLPGSAVAASGSPLPNVVLSSKLTSQTLRLTWPSTADLLSISHSYDLFTWTPLTNLPGSSGSLELPCQPGPEFFKAIRSGPGGTNEVPLEIQR